MLQTLQIPLRLPLRDDALFDNFFPGKNAQLIDQLINIREPFIYCYGESGSGRTHLLQATCHYFQNKKNIFYLPLAEHADYSPAILDALESQHIVCLDDVDSIMGNRLWEEALFHFYNRARDHHTTLLFSATQTPQQLKISLPDLQSRLTSALILEIKALTDAEKIEALKMRANARGLSLTSEIANYVLHHYSRNMRDLMRLLSACDEISLITKRKLSVPFIKKILTLLQHEEE